MKVYAATHVGKVRTVNEDSVCLPAEGERFVAVADGMGGHQAGEVASAIAVRELADALREAEQPNEEHLRRAVSRANAVIHAEAQLDSAKRGMGTTLTALWFGEKYVYLSHVGDSRAYLLRNRALMQMTNDHSLVSELVARGEITPSQALTHPQRNYITRALGTGKHVEADILRVDARPDDVWFLCTDGLSNYLRSMELAEVLSRPGLDWPDRLEALIALALERGGGDNITALVAVGEGAYRP